MRLADILPEDWRDAILLGRIETSAGPTPVVLRDGRVWDISERHATSAGALSQQGLSEVVGDDFVAIEDLTVASQWGEGEINLLSPLDLQCVKASGVTFAVSALERVIEEQARGQASVAAAIRERLSDRIGGDLASVKPGSDQAAALKVALISDGLWSQYLEVAIGPDAEIFTKAPCLSTVGWGAHVGVRSDSAWNNPEPEVVLICDPTGQAVGATLGNDVNLRDIEGRSALLLGKAKDNNAAAAVGPFIRLFDRGFTLDDVRAATISLEVRGTDDFVLSGSSSMSLISRDPEDLAKQASGASHQYPDGFALYLGTMFAPVEDRDTPGGGFTHKIGDRVRVSSPRLGVLENEVTTCDRAAPWTMGILGLMQNLAARGLLAGGR